MEESALVAKAEKYLKEISNDSIRLDNIEEFENFKRLYYKLDDRLNSLQELKESMDAQGYTTPFTSLNKYGTKAIAEVSLEEMSENSRHNQMFRMKANAKKNVLDRVKSAIDAHNIWNNAVILNVIHVIRNIPSASSDLNVKNAAAVMKTSLLK